jgi:hypothetical protein
LEVNMLRKSIAVAVVGAALLALPVTPSTAHDGWGRRGWHGGLGVLGAAVVGTTAAILAAPLMAPPPPVVYAPRYLAPPPVAYAPAYYPPPAYYAAPQGVYYYRR